MVGWVGGWHGRLVQFFFNTPLGGTSRARCAVWTAPGPRAFGSDTCFGGPLTVHGVRDSLPHLYYTFSTHFSQLQKSRCSSRSCTRTPRSACVHRTRDRDPSGRTLDPEAPPYSQRLSSMYLTYLTPSSHILMSFKNHEVNSLWATLG